MSDGNFRSNAGLRQFGTMDQNFSFPPETTQSHFDVNEIPAQHEFELSVACSQPAETSLLNECQSNGSLFSVASAPPVQMAVLDVKQVDALVPTCNIAGNSFASVTSAATAGAATTTGVMGYGGLPLGGSVQNTFTSVLSASSMDANSNSAANAVATLPRRPLTLPIEPTLNARTLHASLLEHQISEIEEEDNENLLTVSSITARPLIAKSRELRFSRQQQKQQQLTKRAKRQRSNANSTDGARQQSAGSSQSSVSADPPDGGYGWLIVFGAFSVQFWVAGLVKSYGVLYVEIMETFPSTTATVASWIPAILSALCLALAPLSSALCQKFSCRSVVFVGGLFCAFGLALSYFATSLLHLLFTFGILTGTISNKIKTHELNFVANSSNINYSCIGIGGGLSTTPGIVIVSQYFDSHRALANGICVSGTAAGSFILPILIKHLAEAFGFHTTILILGCCMLHVCISATLYKPLEEYNNDNSIIEDEEEVSKPLNDINPSNTDILTNSTYLTSCGEPADAKYIEHLFMEESKNRLNDYYNSRNGKFFLAINY